VQYFNKYNDYFWDEAEDYALIIPDFNTICFREYLVEILEQLSIVGLPRLGPLLAVIAATNKSTGQSNVKEIERILKIIFNQSLPHEVLLAMDFLFEIVKVESALKDGVNRKMLIQKIFENSHGSVSKKESMILCTQLNNNYDAFTLPFNYPIPNQEESKKHLQALAISDFRVLALIRRNYRSIEDLLNALPQLENEIHIEKQHSTKTNLLDILEEHSLTEITAILAKRLISTLHIPHHHTLPSEQPIGGVSDITNKGNYDQLLISEFANEDHVFLSRLANNEALFIRREVPPLNNKLKRHIVIDTSISSWGNTRRISFAIMLAIANHPKSDFDCSAYSIDKVIKEIDINNATGIIDGLSNLDISINCSDGLEMYLRENSIQKNIENIFIGEKNLLTSSKFAREYQTIRNYFSYIFMVEEEGSIELYKSSKSGLRSIQKMNISMDEIIESKRKEPVNYNPNIFPENIPILVSNSSNPKSVLINENNEVYILNRDSSLIKKYNNSLHNENRYEPVMEYLPHQSDEICIGINDKNETLLLMLRGRNDQFLIHNLTNSKETILDIENGLKGKSKGKLIYYNYNFYTNLGLKINEDEVIICENRTELEAAITAHTSHSRYFKNSNRLFYSAPSVIKKLDRVGLSKERNLQINYHELIFNSTGHIFLRKMEDKKKPYIFADRINNTQFQFYNNLIVTLHNAGYISIFNGQTNETIYLPAIVGERICLSTAEVFSGDKSFFREDLYSISLNHKVNKMNIENKISDLLKYDPIKCQKIIDLAPCILMSSIKYDFAKSICEELNLIQPNIASIKQISNNTQEIIEPKNFFDQYLNPILDKLV
jgi:hypothetical protein